MPLIEHYVLRRAAGLFLVSLSALTAAAWVTQVLTRLDVVTAKGQALWVFLLMTISVLPAIIQVVAPVAFLIGVIVTLNRMINDSELPVVAAAGAPPRVIKRPILALGVVVMLGLAASYHLIAPAGLALLRTILSHVRSDVIASLVQDGSFHTLEDGLTMHFRQRMADGTFADVFISDTRDTTESRMFSAEFGRLIESAGGPFLVLQNGDLLVEEGGGEDFVSFDTYAIDLRLVGSAGNIPVFKAVERSTFYLLSPVGGDPYSEAYPLKVRAEIYDRVSAPLYVIVFALIALGYLGHPRTNRDDRTVAIFTAVLLCVTIRGLGYGAFVVGRSVSEATWLVYAVPLAGLAYGIYANLRPARVLSLPRAMSDWVVRASKRAPGRNPVSPRVPDAA